MTRLRGVIDAIDRRLRARQGMVRAALALLGIALIAVLAATAWPIIVELHSEQAAAADPRPRYVGAVQEKIQRVSLAALAKARAKELPTGLRLRIQVDAEGRLVSAKIVESSGDPAIDDMTLRIVAAAAPFGPFPQEMRKTTSLIELDSEFFFH